MNMQIVTRSCSSISRGLFVRYRIRPLFRPRVLGKRLTEEWRISNVWSTSLYYSSKSARRQLTIIFNCSRCSSSLRPAETRPLRTTPSSVTMMWRSRCRTARFVCTTFRSCTTIWKIATIFFALQKLLGYELGSVELQFEEIPPVVGVYINGNLVTFYSSSCPINMSCQELPMVNIVIRKQFI